MRSKSKGYLEIISLVIVLSSVLFISGCELFTKPEDSKEEPKLTVLLDTAINASAGNVTVIIPNKIRVEIPQGEAPNGTKLTISKIETTDAPQDNELELYEVYDVKLSTGTQFTKPLKITFSYEPSKVPAGIFKNNMGIAYYDEGIKKWIKYQNAEIDTNNHSIKIETNHLTKLVRWGRRNIYGYTDFLTTPHFYIYWKEGDPMTNQQYDSPNKAINFGAEPYYIQDIARYIEDAYTAFSDLKLSVHSGKVDVYVTDLGTDYGEASYFGYIYINRRMEGEKGVVVPVADMLQSTCAHEYLHYVQDYYYATTGAGKVTTVKWWMEATATQADKMVWPSRAFSEAEWYAHERITAQIRNSWDDCNSDPEWYIAGGFLTYISRYRNGTKASIAQLINDAGASTELSYYRTIVDNHLKKQCGSLGIGIEYHDYLKNAYEQKIPIRFSLTYPTTNDVPYASSVILDETKQEYTINSTLPYLSANMIKIADKHGTKKTVKIVAKTIPDGTSAYLYSLQKSGTPQLIKILSQKDTVFVDMPLTTQWLDILIINKTKDDQKNSSFEISLKDKQDNTDKLNMVAPVFDYSYDGGKTGISGVDGDITISKTTPDKIKRTARIKWNPPPSYNISLVNGTTFWTMDLVITLKFEGSDHNDGGTFHLDPMYYATGWYYDMSVYKGFTLSSEKVDDYIPGTKSTNEITYKKTIYYEMSVPGSSEDYKKKGLISIKGYLKDFFGDDGKIIELKYTY